MNLSLSLSLSLSPFCLSLINSNTNPHREKNTMFRDYLKRLEQHKKCQNLSMQSFLLLPMQRITRLPLLVLAILNKTPLAHPDHGLVENALRAVQKVKTT